jgi:hypothetical protein
MREDAQQRADDLKAHALPQAHRPLIRGDGEVELDGTEAVGRGFVERMRSHHPRHPAAVRLRRGHVAVIAHMGAAAPVIGVQVVGADRMAVFLGDKHRIPRRVRISQRVGARSAPGWPRWRLRRLAGLLGFAWRPPTLLPNGGKRAIRVGGNTFKRTAAYCRRSVDPTPGKFVHVPTAGQIRHALSEKEKRKCYGKINRAPHPGGDQDAQV